MPGTQRKLTDSWGNTFAWSFSLPTGTAISCGIGFLSSALGIGGGIFHMPAMIHLLFFPVAVATATSQFIVVFSSLVGGATHLTLGNVLFGPAALMGIGVVAGAQVGGALAKQLRGALFPVSRISPSLMNRLVSVVPTVVLVESGRIIDLWSGALPPAFLERVKNALFPEAATQSEARVLQAQS